MSKETQPSKTETSHTQSSIQLNSEDSKTWEAIRASLREKGSTSISHFPVLQQEVQEVATQLLSTKIREFLDKLNTVFEEDYIIFKDDAFGWLRKEKRLIPFHKGTEDIIDLGSRNNTQISNKEIAKGLCGISGISAEMVKQYEAQDIPYKNTLSVVGIPMEKIIGFYTKYDEKPSKGMNKIREYDFIDHRGTNRSDSWLNFCYEGGVSVSYESKSFPNRYLYSPYRNGTVYPTKAWAFVISKPMKFDAPYDVLDYALTNFSAPRHPLFTDLDYKLYKVLKSLYTSKSLTKGNLVENTCLEPILETFANEIKSTTKYEDINNLFCQSEFNEAYKIFLDRLLTCDTNRANLQAYDPDMIRDINKGHWDLFEIFQQDRQAGDVLLPVPADTELVARDPLADVNYKASCAIDFGTKSTVVVYHDSESVLLRIGASDLWSKPRLDDYENPTAINLLDYHRFMKDYAKQEGRPPTRWEDMTVSHQAANAIFNKEVDKDIYYSVFSELKQWANATGRRQLLRDRKGEKVELKPYTMIEEGDFDPIEIYAYYLGLNINNMHRGICVKYYLSFPVNYALDVRNRILASFTRGIKKSLPTRVLHDTQSMKRFKVKAGASEPAAYALSALKAYGVEPTDGTSKAVNTYAVFDFGGGTTDFDFGIEYIPEEPGFDYEVKQFGNGGDPLLGGENILNILAYEVYKANLEEMRSKKITIVRPNDKCSRFAGSEMLVKEPDEGDQASYLNLKILASRLRGVWEERGNFDEEFKTGKTKIDLYSADEKRETPELVIDVKRLQDVITAHISDGVDNFMKTYLRTHEFNTAEWTWPLHILLAGNSCKSRILQQVLISRLLDHVKSMSKQLKGERDVTDVIRIYPPLGSTFDMDKLNLNPKGDKETEEILKKMLYGYKPSIVSKGNPAAKSSSATTAHTEAKTSDTAEGKGSSKPISKPIYMGSKESEW